MTVNLTPFKGRAPMTERLTTEHLRIEYRDDPDLLALMDEYEVLRARVAKLETALISMTKGANWKSADKDNMEFEGRVTCYQLDQARAALKD
jgi:hypothetical protein